MAPLLDAFGAVRDFLAAGGWVLWAIFATAVGMWTLIIERAWFFQGACRHGLDAAGRAWDARVEHSSWPARRIRDQLICELRADARRGLPLIRGCLAVLPLLGLLGTVWGMIAVFEALAHTGTGNARAMASGVYKATLPTMAGLVAALSGLYPASRLTRRADAVAARAAQRLVVPGARG